MRGILLINKAQNMTSHDVVAILRRKLGIKRIGHTGTLDPMVTGVLPICIGNATRVSEYIMQQGKVYDCLMEFGKSTTSFDSYGEDVNFSDNKTFSKDEIIDAFEHFTGEYEQTPPIYSAIKVKGRKLYSYARNNEMIEIPKKKVTIYKLELAHINESEVRFKIHCSKGTYVRSLVNDIGIYLGSFAYMKDLVRTDVGRFNIKDCIDILDIKEIPLAGIEKSLIRIEDSLYNLAKIEVFSDVYDNLSNGQKIELSSLDYAVTENHLNNIDYSNIVVYVQGDFLGIGAIDNNILKMERVLKSD